MPRGKILLVEDDKATRDTIGSILELEGYSVVKAADGEEGILALLSNPGLRLILLDLMMPRVNGWGFLDFVRAHHGATKIPVVIVSAYTEIARSIKPHAIVPKPVKLDTLLDTVGMLVH